MAPCCGAADVAVKDSQKSHGNNAEADSDTSEDTSEDEDEDATASASGTASRATSRTSHRQDASRKSSDMRDMIATGLKSFTSNLMKSFTAGKADVAKELTAGEKAAEERAKVPHWQQVPSAKEMRAMQQAQLEAKRLKEEQEQTDRVHHNTLEGRSLATSRQTSINNHTAAFSRQASHSTHAAINSHAPSASTSRRASVADHTEANGAGSTLQERAFSRQRSNSTQLPALAPSIAPAGRLPSLPSNRVPPLQTTLSSQTRVLSPTTSAVLSRPGSGNPEQLSLTQHHHGLAMISHVGTGTGMGVAAGVGVGMAGGMGTGTTSRPTSGVISGTPLSPALSRQASGAAYRGLTQYDPNTDYLSMLTSSANTSQAHSAGMLSKSASLNDHTATGRGHIGTYGATKSLKQRFADMPHLPGVVEEGAADMGSGRLTSV